MSRKINVVIKKPGEVGVVYNITDTLEELQNIVGGYIETFPFSPLGGNLLIILDEEGKLKDKEVNLEVTSRGETVDVIVGTIIIVRENPITGELQSLDCSDILMLKSFGYIDDTQIYDYDEAKEKDRLQYIMQNNVTDVLYFLEEDLKRPIECSTISTLEFLELFKDWNAEQILRLMETGMLLKDEEVMNICNTLIKNNKKTLKIGEFLKNAKIIF